MWYRSCIKTIGRFLSKLFLLLDVFLFQCEYFLIHTVPVTVMEHSQTTFWPEVHRYGWLPVHIPFSEASKVQEVVPALCSMAAGQTPHTVSVRQVQTHFASPLDLRWKQSRSRSTSTDPNVDADVGGYWPCRVNPAGRLAHCWWIWWSSLCEQQAKSNEGTKNLSLKLSSEDTKTQILVLDSSFWQSLIKTQVFTLTIWH